MHGRPRRAPPPVLGSLPIAGCGETCDPCARVPTDPVAAHKGEKTCGKGPRIVRSVPESNLPGHGLPGARRRGQTAATGPCGGVWLRSGPRSAPPGELTAAADLGGLPAPGLVQRLRLPVCRGGQVFTGPSSENIRPGTKVRPPVTRGAGHPGRTSPPAAPPGSRISATASGPAPSSSLRTGSTPRSERSVSSRPCRYAPLPLSLAPCRPSRGAQFVAYTLWKNLFGVNADSLEKSTQQDDECARGRSPPSCSAAPAPPLPSRRPCPSHDFRARAAHDALHFGAARHGPAQLRGVWRRRHPRRPPRSRSGACCVLRDSLPRRGRSPSATSPLALQPCTVSAHFVDNPAGDHDKTVYLIKFEPQVMRRESRLG